MTDQITDRQKALEKHAERTLFENNIEQKDTLNGMMKVNGYECDYENRTITFIFPVQKWQANRAGQMHGGAICTAFDLTFAALARFFAGENFTPTISIDVKYIRPVEIDDTLRVTAKATATGRRITQLTGEAYRERDGKLVATGTSVCMNVASKK